ncbi:riboflavin synthase [Enterococcus avium]|uniref:riboflavin synthase n=1 Tax=Enterococcus avium TaxID=33945 RepID=UPI002A91DA9C|nr:riboflavin synthase [Enterococcus avium]MDY6442103.1 riboflavin synthase [Enterococcus avium]MDY6447847.1 riboflavin synthase [Enterococcus avium]MDY6454305.1 riboflavin synthase [Enterococcus avium]MDY6474464.1 riboflavin synthase [Enterococcus avium]
MFTGLIQEQGHIKQIRHQGQTILLTCQASESLLADYAVGDSMAINGVCLTAVKKDQNNFTVDIMPETYQRTTFATAKMNDPVNLERALQFNGRLEGHLVAGHVDCTTRLVEKRVLENALILTFDYPKKLQGEIIPQGSIAINGVSLTVIEISQRHFSIGLIPHSKDQTNLGKLNRGEQVNIETDLIGKYLKVQGQRANRKEMAYE